MKHLYLVLLALFPIVILSVILLRREKWGKARASLFVRLSLGGAVMTALAIFLGMPLLAIFPDYFNYRTLLGTTLMSFICFGLVEELCKMLPVLTFAWRQDDTRRLRDNMLCCGISALGFAAVENVLYVSYSGVKVGILRALITVPAHCAFGIVMGYFLFRVRHTPQERQKTLYAALALIVPALLHGLFDALILTQKPAFMLMGVGIGLVTIGLAFRLLAKTRRRPGLNLLPALPTVPVLTTDLAKAA